MEKTASPEWTSVFNKTLEICREDANYQVYSARERMLAFVYTFLQNIQEDEVNYKALLQQNRLPVFNAASLNELRSLFVEYSDSLVFDGTNSGEIQARPVIANYYNRLLWNAFRSILLFWSHDNSDHKENTDVMVEKTVHFTFDLLAPSAVDSGIDLVQHFFKLRR